MKVLRRGAELIIYSVLFWLCLAACVRAEQAVSPWFGHDFGQAEVTVHLKNSGEAELLLEGLFMFKYPSDFCLSFSAAQGEIVIRAHRDFVEIIAAGERKYGYDRHWLFEYFADYVFRLAELSVLPLVFSGETELAQRTACRYFDQNDPQTVLWFDDSTWLPLLALKGDQTLLSVIDLDCGEAQGGQCTSAKLELNFSEIAAEIGLVCADQIWSPASLKMDEAGGEVEINFTAWDFAYDFTEHSELDLKELRRLNERFFGETAQGQWNQALATCRQMLVLAPGNLTVYLLQAFVYEKLADFLGVVENYQQVLMREPEHVLALNNLAYHYFLKEIQIAQAMEMAEKAVSLERKAAYLDTLGYGYYLSGRYEDARLLLEEALAGASEEEAEEVAGHLELVLKALAEREQK